MNKYEGVFEVGDRVIIKNPDNCMYGCCKKMREYDGMEVYVIEADVGKPGDCPVYRVDIDGGEFSWCNYTLFPCEDTDIQPRNIQPRDISDIVGMILEN